MPAAWYARIGDRQTGPLSYEQLKALAAQGQLTRQSSVKQGDSPWMAAQLVAGLFEAPAAAPPVRAAAAPPPPRNSGTLGARPVAAAPAQSVRPATPRPALSSAAAPPLPAPPRGAGVRAAEPLPVGQVVSAPAASAPAPAFPLVSTQSTSHARGENTASAPKGKNNALPLLIGGGVVAACLIGVLLYVLMAPGSKAAKSTEVAKKGETTAATETDESATASEPDDAAPAKEPTTKAAAKPAAAEKTPPANAADAACLKLASTITKWRGLGTAVGLREQFSLKITNAYFVGGAVPVPAALPASDAVEPPAEGEPPVADEAMPDEKADGLATQSNPEAPNEPAAESAAPADSAPAESAPAASRGLLFVEVEITNSNPSRALVYTGWNIRGAKGPAAFVLDEQDRLVSPESGKVDSAAKRMLKPASIQAGKSVTDLLVFSAPSADATTLRLVLSCAALGMEERAFGFELPVSSLPAGPPASAVAGAAAKGAAAAVSPTGRPSVRGGIDGVVEPAEKPAPAPLAKAPDEPPANAGPQTGADAFRELSKELDGDDEKMPDAKPEAKPDEKADEPGFGAAPAKKKPAAKK